MATRPTRRSSGSAMRSRPHRRIAGCLPKAANWTGTFDATQFGPCAEQSVINGYGDPDPDEDERGQPAHQHLDAEGRQQEAPRPRLHPRRRLHPRSPGRPYYNGKRMAQKGVVYCDLSYRLGPFGFMNISDVPGAPAEYKASGNLGLLDQRMALKFVHDNIARFGGDPDRVTVAGGSAGAWSTTIHMALPAEQQVLPAGHRRLRFAAGRHQGLEHEGLQDDDGRAGHHDVRPAHGSDPAAAERCGRHHLPAVRPELVVHPVPAQHRRRRHQAGPEEEHPRGAGQEHRPADRRLPRTS